ncbi:folate family ECF transporter S component [Bombilactobacillus bombi]|uniref:Folate family ECF transporter S component n=2 Tax=Bombilactobacillus bombi TaxID=1303590 RepID=A0A3R6YI67_9LACO|nr:folate family ECF transporter S component [Bombilactobacillus bombi]
MVVVLYKSGVGNKALSAGGTECEHRTKRRLTSCDFIAAFATISGSSKKEMLKMNKIQSMSKTMGLTWLAILMALQMILGRVHVGPNFLKVGFGFIATALIGYYFGPWKSMLVGFISDVITNSLFPDGAFFWGFTLSAVVGGFIYGVMLYQKPATIGRILLTTILVVLIVDLGLNTEWVSILGKVNFMTMFWIRIWKELIFIPIQTGILVFVFKWLKQHQYD